jgi:DNA mismatch repair protein MSH4
MTIRLILVPGDYASFPIFSAFLSRLNNDDSIEAGLSTFAMEMKSMSMILGVLENLKDESDTFEDDSEGSSTVLGRIRNRKRSLVIVDELGRGTSPNAGIGIAQALAEELIRKRVGSRCST